MESQSQHFTSAVDFPPSGDWPLTLFHMGFFMDVGEITPLLKIRETCDIDLKLQRHKLSRKWPKFAKNAKVSARESSSTC